MRAHVKKHGPEFSPQAAVFSDCLEPDLNKLCTVVRHDPERHSNVLMPCAVCGFEAAQSGDVRRKGLKSTCRGIVCFGGQTRFLGGVLYWCKRCKVKHDEQKKSAASTAASSSASAPAPKHHYHWMSYDPRITKLYVEKGRADVTQGLKAIVFNRGYCWDSALARFLRLSWGAGMCAEKMAKLLSAVAAAEFDCNTLLPFLHSQLKHQKAGTLSLSQLGIVGVLRSHAGLAPSEPVETTLPSAPQLPYEPVSLKATECGVFSPGPGPIRRLCNDLQEADENYQFVHREDTIGCYVAQCDHTDKYLLVNQYAPHVFSIMNERGEILLRIATATTSYNDPALVAALKALFGKSCLSCYTR